MKSFLAVVVLVFLSLPAFSAEPIVKQIEIKGLKRIDEYAVRNKISQKVGAPLSPGKISDDIKAIYGMGYFDDVRVDMDLLDGGIRLIYTVKEKPVIASISFYGNEEYEDDKLREKISLSRGAIADPALIQDNALKIKSFYESEGYWLAEVIPVIRKITESDVAVSFLIREHEKVDISKIELQGNKALSDSDIKDVMKTSEWWIFSWITSGGHYSASVMKQDVENIKNLYFNNGYINVKVGEPETILDKKDNTMTIKISISEGHQYKISELNLAGNKAFSNEELMKKIKVRAGEIFRRNLLADDIRALTEFYSERGYALISVDPEVVPDQAADTVRLTYHIIEGSIYHIGRIEIEGNTKTKDKVIRREMRLDEGDLFNSALIKRSYQRLNNLNFFDSVQLQPKPRPEEDLLDLDVSVKEKATGSLSVGGGYSTTDKLIGMVDLTQANLFGTGKMIKLKGEFGSRTTLYELSYTDPWFLDKELSMTTSLYKTSHVYPLYELKRTGFGLGFGKPFGEYWRANVGYNLENDKYLNIQSTASPQIQKLAGSWTTSSVSPSIVRDSRDYFLDPHEGSRNALYLDIAGFGGNRAYFRGILDSGWFLPVGPTTVAFRARFGYATGLFGKPLPDDAGFYVGGIDTVRGLGYGQGGPREITVTRDPRTGKVISTDTEYVSGSKELIFNLEYIFPLVPEARLKGVLFFDAGRAYAQNEPIESLRYTTGLGVRWISPIGPLRLEWGYNLHPFPGESHSKFEFTFGTFF